jgi:uncharacterized protein YjeT (DUF2065 family)
MASKKLNEIADWKGKLAALDGLPDEAPLNKSDRWQQLNDRLQQKGNRKKLSWYWVAASILLLLTTLLWIVNPKQTNRLAPALAKQPSPKALLRSLPTAAVDTLHNPAGLATKTITKPELPISRQQKDTMPGLVEPPQLMASVETVAVAKVLPHLLQVDTPLVAAVATPLPTKKKLPVVHVNELDYPAATGPRTYTGQDYSVQQNKFINQPIYSTVSPGTGGIQLTISPTKKFSTN